MSELSWRKGLGICLLVLSTLAWCALPVLPFLSFDAKELAAVAGGVFIFAEVTWWLSVPLLGKEMLGWLKLLWDQIIAKISK